MTQSAENDVLEQAARAVAIAAGDGRFARIDQRDCGCENDCSDHEDADYYRSLARAALVSARDTPAAISRCQCRAHADEDADCICTCPLHTHVGDISDDGWGAR